MAVEERDPHTGYLTTGHEWNGIKELNTPVPKAVYFFLIATFLFSLGYWVLMPAWPIGSTYTKGLLGIDQREIVAEELRQSAAKRAAWMQQIESGDYAAIQADQALMQAVRETGRTLFVDNCAVCHGIEGKGGPGFPNLAASSWLWGGAPEAIAETIRVGINAAHAETRVSQMPAFGRDQMLSRGDIDALVPYVRSLADPALVSGAAADKVATGRTLFVENCAACHGEDAKGSVEVGAPDLTDAASIYGSSEQAIRDTLVGGRQGHMPTWQTRLSPVERKILALYVLDLGEPRP